MDFLSDGIAIFDQRVNSINVDLIEAVATFTESCNDSFYVTERQKDTLFVKIKKFFADMIIALKNFKNQIITDVNRKVRESKIDMKLRSLHKDLKNSDQKTTEIEDVWALKNTYLDAVFDLKSYAKRVSKMEYRNTIQIDSDLEDFNKILAKYEEKIEKISEKKKKVSTVSLLKFVEDELSGRSKVLDTLNDSITIMEQMKNDVEALEAKKAILGPDVIPKHVGFLRKIANKIAAFFRKHIAKFISRFVFLFA